VLIYSRLAIIPAPNSGGSNQAVMLVMRPKVIWREGVSIRALQSETQRQT
jgi:hypothetical protein